MTMPIWTPSCWISPISLAIWVAAAGIDAEGLLAHQGFAGEFEEDARDRLGTRTDYTSGRRLSDTEHRGTDFSRLTVGLHAYACLD